MIMLIKFSWNLKRNDCISVNIVFITVGSLTEELHANILMIQASWLRTLGLAVFGITKRQHYQANICDTP